MNLRKCVSTIIPLSLVLVFPAVPGAVPVNQWSKRFGDADIQATRAVAFDASGNGLVTGYMYGSADFGGGALVSGGDADAFLAKYDASGAHLWSKRFGAADHQEGLAVAADAAGNVFLMGRFAASINLGGPTHVGAGNFDIFIAKFDPSGSFLWSKSIGNGDINEARSMAVDGAGHVLIAGFTTGATDFGGGALPSSSEDAFIAKYDGSGAHLWSKLRGDGKRQESRGVCVDASDNVFLVGWFESTVDWGGGNMTGVSSRDAFLVKFDPSGAWQWNKKFGVTGNTTPLAVGCDAVGNVVMSGYFDSNLDLGGGNLLASGSSDIFLAMYSPTGTYAWGAKYGTPQTEEPWGMAVHSTGNVILTGYSAGNINFGGGALPNAGSEDCFMARFSPSGVHVWSANYGSAGYQSGFGAAITAGGAILLGGQFENSVNFGTGPLTSAGSTDASLARFSDDTPIPVAFQDFRASARGGGVEVRWSLWSDGEMESFTLYRREGNAAPSIRVVGGAVDAATGSFVDNRVVPGTTYHYELVIREKSGDEFRSPVATVTMPGAIATLGPNYPNPFNPSTRIQYSLGERSDVVLEIFNAAGTLVTRIEQGMREPGVHALAWDGRDSSGQGVGSGVYFYRIAGLPRAGTGKMVLLK